MFDTFIWDFDGTLYDTYPVIVDGFEKALKEFGISESREAIYRILKEESSSALAMKHAINFKELSKIFETFEQQDVRIPISYVGTKEALCRVKESGKRNLILTHRSVSSTKELLEKEGLFELFDEIVGSDSGFPRKPDPMSLLYFIDKYHLDSNRTVMIGDRKMDIDAGKNAGVRTIFCDYEQLLGSLNADFTLSEVTKIIPFIND